MALRRQLQRDGTYSLSTRGGADIVLNTVLTRYERHELSLLPNDVLTVRDYRVSVTAQVSARETGSGKLLLDQTVTAYTLVRVGSDLTSSERQALPVLADGLAKNITALLGRGKLVAAECLKSSSRGHEALTSYLLPARLKFEPRDPGCYEAQKEFSDNLGKPPHQSQVRQSCRYAAASQTL